MSIEHMSMLICPMCDIRLEVQHKRTFMKHIRSHESLNQITWPFTCGQLGCSKTFIDVQLFSDYLLNHKIEFTLKDIKNSFLISNDEILDGVTLL